MEKRIKHITNAKTGEKSQIEEDFTPRLNSVYVWDIEKIGAEIVKITGKPETNFKRQIQ